MPTINYNYYPNNWTITDRSNKIGNINLFHKAATPASWGGRIYTSPSWIQLYARLDTTWWNAYYNNPCGPGSGCSLDLGVILYEFPKESSNVPIDFIPMNWAENSFFEVGNVLIYGQEINDASKRRYWGFFGLVPYGTIYSIDTITGFNIAIPENEDSFCNNSYDLLSGIGRNISTDQRFPYNIPNGILFGISTGPCTSDGGKENFILVVKKDGTLYRGNYQAGTNPPIQHNIIIRCHQGNTILSIDGTDRITLSAVPSGTLKPLWGIGSFSDTSTYGNYTPSVKLNNINIGTLSPANITSTTLTVDKNNCTELCTVNGNVSWTNTGDIINDPIDLSITYDGNPIPIAPAVTINPGEIKSYTFSIPNLIAGVHTICASPDSGTTCQTITVNTPTHIISSTLTVDKNGCIELCTVNGNISWTNNGGTTSDPTDLGITVDNVPIILAPGVIIPPNTTTSTYPFSVQNLPAGVHTICASPDSGTTCQTITVNTPAHITSTTLTVDKNICTAPCTVSGTVSWTNNGGTTSDPTDLSIIVNGTQNILAPGAIIPPNTITSTYPFSLPDLLTGTYEICASPDSGTTCQTIIVRTPASIISSTLTVDKNDCTELCTVNGTVSWTNNGGTTSDPTDLGITVNGAQNIVSPGVTIGPGETTTSYPFSLPDLLSGTYEICASPDAGTTCQIITVRTPANVMSKILTVDTNSCTAPCTVSGNVSWINNGETASDPIDLSITVDGNQNIASSGVTINPGEIKSYTFSIPNLIAGTHIICASPDAGTTCQIVTVKTPANIDATIITPSATTCVEPCDITVDVTWTNTGETAGSFIPSIKIDDVPISPEQYPLEELAPGNNTTHTFTIIGLVKGDHVICATPSTIETCTTVTVTEKVAEAGFGAFIGAGLIFGLLLSSDECKKYKTKDTCEKAGCKWIEGKCVKNTKNIPKKHKG